MLFSNSRHYTMEFKIILCLDKMITQNAFYIKQNLKAYEALQAGTPAHHGSHHFTVSSLKACWLWCVIMHHRANVSPVSQPPSTLSASTSQPSSTARARPHDDWGDCWLFIQSSEPRCGAAHGSLWGLHNSVDFSETIIHRANWSDLVYTDLSWWVM